jgi:hypothetical protein
MKPEGLSIETRSTFTDSINYFCAISYRSRRQPSINSSNNLDTANVAVAKDDVLAGLFDSAPKDSSGDNGISALQSFHRKILERLFPQALWSSSESTPALSPESEGARSSPGVIQTTPRPAITANQVNKYLSRFESLNAYFPFVTLPQGWTVRSILQNQPFLALGILSAMSQLDLVLHRKLDAEFKRVLSEKVTMNGDKSLDILQGLLVHIAW